MRRGQIEALPPMNHSDKVVLEIAMAVHARPLWPNPEASVATPKGMWRITNGQSQVGNHFLNDLVVSTIGLGPMLYAR